MYLSNTTSQELIDAIINRTPGYSMIIVQHWTEWEYSNLGEFRNFETLIDYANHFEIPLIIPLGSSGTGPLLHDPADNRYRNLNLIFIPNYLFVMYFRAYRYKPYWLPKVKDITNNDLNCDLSYLFISLNNRPHLHRCMLMDLLAKEDLISKGAMSWNSQSRNWGPDDRNISYTEWYQFRYWQPELLILDNRSEETLARGGGWELQLPWQFSKSWMQIVPESSDTTVFFTEKVIPSLLFCKPFLVAGGPYYHKVLTDFGFQLYDELFDYSFDSELDLEKRLQLIVDNVNRYRNYSFEQLATLRQSIMPKLIHNKLNFIKVATDVSVWPQQIVDLINQRETGLYDLDIGYFYDMYKNGYKTLDTL